MKNSIFNAVCKTRYLALLVVLIFTCGNVWGADVTGTINFGSASGSTNINAASVTGDDSQDNTWTVTTVGTTSFTPNAAYAQVGAKKSPATSITFTTTLPSAQTIKSMSAKFGGFSGTAGTVTLKVGDNSIGTGSLNETSDVTVSSTDGTKSGTVLTVTVTGIAKGVKCYYISYTYSTGGGGTCATPTFSPAAGSFCGSEDVTLSCTTNGATIRYTTNGNTPTESSSAYSSAIHLTSTTTIKAKAFKSGYTASSEASATYTNTALTTMDAIYSAATGSEVATCITFNNWVISGVSDNGKNVYLTDGTKGLIIYNSGGNSGFAVGDILSGSATCNLKMFNNSAELVGLTSTTTGLSVSTGGTAAATVVDASAISALEGINTGRVVTTTGVCSEDNSKFYINGAQIYNQLLPSASYTDPTPGVTYTVTGVYLQYGATQEILPLSNLTTFTITAQSNNNSYGTVSVSNGVITATPASGYRVSTTTAYEVTVGTATVTDNGDNTFTVTPSSDCTVRINFEAIPTHTISFNTGGLVTIPSVTVAEGVVYNIEQTPSASLSDDCEYNTFVGWTTASSIADPSVCPSVVTSVTMSTSDVALYAVYSKTVGGGGSTPASITLLPSDFGASYPSGAEGSGTITKGDYSFTYGQYTRNQNGTPSQWCAGQLIQARCTLNIGLWNTTAMDITSVVLYKASPTSATSTWDVYESSSASRPTEGAIEVSEGSASSITVDKYYSSSCHSGELTGMTETPFTYTANSGCKYINIAPTKGASYFTKIIINYTVGGGGTTTYSMDAGCCDNVVEAPTVSATNIHYNQFTLSWTNVTGADDYTVTCTDGTVGSVESSGETRTCTITELTTNTSYSWTVVATYSGIYCGATPAAGSTTTTKKKHYYVDRMHGTNDGHTVTIDGVVYNCYLREGAYTVPTINDNTSGASACHSEHDHLLFWVTASSVNADGTLKNSYTEVTPGSNKTASTDGTVYYAIWGKLAD